MIDCLFDRTSYGLVKKLNELNKKIEVINIVQTNKGDGYIAFLRFYNGRSE